MGKGRRAMWARVSLLLSMHKHECLQNILDGMLLAPAHNMHPADLAQEAPHGAQAV
jgi:hypothetical protein